MVERFSPANIEEMIKFVDNSESPSAGSVEAAIIFSELVSTRSQLYYIQLFAASSKPGDTSVV